MYTHRQTNRRTFPFLSPSLHIPRYTSPLAYLSSPYPPGEEVREEVGEKEEEEKEEEEEEKEEKEEEGEWCIKHEPKYVSDDDILCLSSAQWPLYISPVL